MALSGSGLSSEIQSALSSIGWNGSELVPFCDAVGKGIINSSSGIITFVTSDTGDTPGNGTGAGVGITGMSDSNMSSVIFSTGQGFWSSLQTSGPGAEWQKFCDAVALAITDHFSANATLTSSHSPVFNGTGTVTIYSGVTASTVTSSIVSEAPSSWATARFPELAESIATGFVSELTGHVPTDIVTITGSPSGPVVPGSGSGSGVVT